MSSSNASDKTAPRNRADLTEGPVSSALLRLVMPMAIGVLAVISQPVADTYFVGLIGTRELAAMAYIFPVSFLIASVLIGLSAGSTAVLSRLVGAKKWAEVKQTTTHAITLALAIVFVVSLIILAFITPIFKAMGAEENLLPIIHDYMEVYCLGLITLVPAMVGSSALRAKGEVRLSSAIMILSAAANAILDPILIFGWGVIPELSFQGAALATILANLLSGGLALWFLVYREDMLRFRLGTKNQVLSDWRALLHVGAPAALTNCISPVSAALLILLVSDYGEEAVAGWGVATRVEALALILPLAISGCIGPFVGQNMGAGKIDRMREAMRLSYIFAAIYCVITFATLATFANQVAQLFDENPETIAYAAAYLFTVSASYPLYGILMITTASFNALGMPRPNMVLYSLKLLVIYLPLAWLGARYYGYEGIIWASALSNVIPGVLALIWFKVQFPRERPEDDALAPV